MIRRVKIESDSGGRQATSRRRAGSVCVGDIVAVDSGSRGKVVAINDRTRQCLVAHGDAGTGGIYPMQAVRRVNAWWNDAQLRRPAESDVLN